MKLCYIAGPYGASTLAEIDHNVARAVALAAYAASCGLAPMITHPLGRVGTFGDPAEAEDGEAVRKRALAYGVHLAELTARDYGFLWVIARDDGTLSAGTQAERDAFLAVSPSGGASHVAEGTWANWVRFTAARAEPYDLEAARLRAFVGVP